MELPSAFLRIRYSLSLNLHRHQLRQKSRGKSKGENKMVTRSTLQKFIRKGGYEIVDELGGFPSGTRREGAGFYKELHSRLGFGSKPTLIAIKNDFPTRKVAEDYLAERIPHEVRRVEKYQETDAYRRLDKNMPLKLQKYKSSIHRVLSRAHYMLGNNEPMNWTPQDIKNLRAGRIEDYDPKTFESRQKIWKRYVYDEKKAEQGFADPINFEFATQFRRAMRILELYELEKAFPHTPLRAPMKKDDWLRENQILSLITKIEEIDTLIAVALQMLGGARVSSVLEIERKNIMNDRVMEYETKISQWVERLYDPSIINLVMDYVNHFNIQDRLFHFDSAELNRRLRKASKTAEISFGKNKYVTTHLLKHTFVTQASLHVVPLEAISEQTGTEVRTLKLYYRGAPSKLAQIAILGVKEEEQLDLPTWIRNIIYPAFKARYDFLIAEGKQVKVNGVIRAEKPIVKKEPKRRTPRKKRTLTQLQAAAEHGATQGLRDWAKRQIEEGNYRE
jgi:hypothetical protein